MKKLLNTLFVTSEDAYLSLDGENIVVSRDRHEIGRFPLHTLAGIVSFSYAGASPALMGGCAKRGVGLTFCTPGGRFLARAVGEENGNVLLRRMQYRVADDPAQSCRIARNMIFGKLHNARWSIERTKRDHALRVDTQRLQTAIDQIKGLYPLVAEETSLDTLRGEEGAGAKVYFDVFDDMILRTRPTSSFTNAAAGRRWITSTRCCRLRTVCSAATVPPRSRASGSMPMSASCTGTARGGPLWRWISWRSCGRALPTGSCCR